MASNRIVSVTLTDLCGEAEALANQLQEAAERAGGRDVAARLTDDNTRLRITFAVYRSVEEAKEIGHRIVDAVDESSFTWQVGVASPFNTDAGRTLRHAKRS
jgi:hypothetical protein